MLDKVLVRNNLLKALKRVESNKGASGVAECRSMNFDPFSMRNGYLMNYSAASSGVSI